MSINETKILTVSPHDVDKTLKDLTRDVWTILTCQMLHTGMVYIVAYRMFGQ